jgi:membrane-associated phospholipid phosphatase
MQKIYRFVDVYPDFATFAIVILASVLQLLIGNGIETIILSVSLMLPTLIVTLPTNILMKRTFKTERPEQYYKNVKKRSVFEGSFPSFHSQFSAGEATTFIVGMSLFSPENLRLIATLLAICTVGLASVVIAWSRVALNVHHAVDAVGGFILGVVTGFAVSYAMARSIWNRFPLAYHIASILIFAVLVFMLSERQRRAMVFTRSHS